MRSDIFKSILSQLDKGEVGRLSVTADGVEYNRLFIPNDRLILLGGGHVSQAVAKMAEMLDFRTVVVDDRPEFANYEVFPTADMVICDSFVEAIKGLEIRESDYVCVLTRGHRWDEECVRALLCSEKMPFYLGMIGSRRRVNGLLEILRADGYPDERLSQLHAPIGLKIGGVTPAEIALSICAEMVMLRSSGAFEQDKTAMEQTNTDYDMLRYAAEGGEDRAMMLVLSSGGSTPVKSGAMMVVNKLGKGFGTIGGGCSEAAAISKARMIIGSGESRIIDFDMTAEVAAENGMVCGGRMKVLIEDITE